ncbi:MAG: hypothetical protein J5I93_08335 [Pirellulaceae bacterium]|nr:hypothetical protein [Pirellulaceae bacterium]
MNITTCVACGGKQLDPGFIPDAGDNRSSVVMGWYAGEPHDRKFLGLKTGSVGSNAQREPIIAYKCADCGFLHLFAI